MDMGMLGVPVIDRHPVEPGAEILFHLPGQIAGKGFEVRHVEGVVGRDDEAEMMPVPATPFGRGAAIRRVDVRPEQPRLLPVPGDAIASQIIEMRAKRRLAGGVTDDARLDHRSTRTGGNEAIGLNAGTLAMPKPRAVARDDPARA